MMKHSTTSAKQDTQHDAAEPCEANGGEKLAKECRAAFASKRFMVVDDFSIMRRIVAGLVRELGVEQLIEGEGAMAISARRPMRFRGPSRLRATL